MATISPLKKKNSHKLPKLIEEEFSDEFNLKEKNFKFYSSSIEICKHNFIIENNLNNSEIKKEMFDFLCSGDYVLCDQCKLTKNEKKFTSKTKSNLNNHQSSFNLSNLSKTTIHKLEEKICSTNISLPSISNETNSQKSDRKILEEKIIQIFQDCKLPKEELKYMHLLVNNINTSTTGPFLFDNYSTQMLPKGLMQLKLKIINNQTTGHLPTGNNLLIALEKTWKDFYTKIVPLIDCIFYRLRENKHDLTIKQISLKIFRDEIVLKLNLKDTLQNCLQNKQIVSHDIKQMLLILYNIFDTFPPQKNKLKLETLCALVVDPFIGYKGLYLNNQLTPHIKSNEPFLYANKKSIDIRKGSRKLSFQPKQMETLSELFLNVVKKQNHKSTF